MHQETPIPTPDAHYEVYPQRKTPANSSQAAADYVVVSVRSFPSGPSQRGSQSFSVYHQGQKQFEVEATGWKEKDFSTERYGKLAREVERRTRKRNLNIERLFFADVSPNIMAVLGEEARQFRRDM